MLKPCNVTVLLGAAVFALVLPVSAQQSAGTAERKQTKTKTATQSTESQSKINPADEKFMMDAAAGGMMEVQLAQVAQKQASSEQVKALAQRIEKDHTDANNELKKIAEERGVSLPTALPPKHQAMIDKLSKLNGAAFDRAYARDMVRDHKADIAKFDKESNNGMDSTVKAFAAKTLPTLREHLRMAQEAAGAKPAAAPAK